MIIIIMTVGGLVVVKMKAFVRRRHNLYRTFGSFFWRLYFYLCTHSLTNYLPTIFCRFMNEVTEEEVEIINLSPASLAIDTAIATNRLETGRGAGH